MSIDDTPGAHEGARGAELDQAIAEVEQQFGYLFQRVRLRWKSLAAKVHPDLQPIGYKILSALTRSGPTHAGALAEHLSTDKSVMSRQVRVLEELGLVESRADERDGRARVLAATPEGARRIREVSADTQAELHQLLKSWPEHDIRKFAELLARLADEA